MAGSFFVVSRIKVTGRIVVDLFRINNMYPNPFGCFLGAFSAVFRLHIHDHGLHCDAQKTPKMTILCYPQEK